MQIKKLILGSLNTNCYLLEHNRQMILIDPADQFEEIKTTLGENQLLAVLLTHSHFDHIGALNQIVEYYHVLVYDYSNLEERTYSIGSFLFDVIYTPGHTKDSLTFYFKKEKIMFSGDFLFYHTIGRTDLGGDAIEMKKSIQKIKQYPEDIIIYPGHDRKTTLKEEFLNNPFFKNIS